jgi:recombination protein RecA
MYGEGVSKEGEIIDLGVKAGVVEKSGSWFSYKGQRIGQGRENARAFLKQNKSVSEAIEAAVRQNAGILANKILGDIEEGADGEPVDDEGQPLKAGHGG